MSGCNTEIIREDETQPWWRCFLRPTSDERPVHREFRGATRFLYGDGSHPACSNIEWNMPRDDPSSLDEPQECKPSLTDSILYQVLINPQEKQGKDKKVVKSMEPSSITYNIYKNSVVNYVTSSKVPKTYKCTICNVSTIRKYNLKRHFETMHTKDQDIKPCCGLNFTTKSDAQQHYYSVHHNVGYKCDYCNKVFSRAPLMKRHMVVHYNIHPFKCHKCEYKSRYKWNVIRHMLNEHHVKVEASHLESCSENSFTMKSEVDCTISDTIQQPKVDWTLLGNTTGESQIYKEQDQHEQYMHKKLRGYKFLY